MKLNYMLGIGIFLSLVGFSLLLAFGFLYVQPYMSVKDFKSTDCVTTFASAGASPYGQVVPCECAADGSSSCTSRYPCVWIKVNFTIEGSNGDELSLVVNQSLYDSYETYILQHNIAQCSYHKCNRVASVNEESIRNFFNRYNTSATYRCYYNPSEPTFAILEVIGLATVVNCIFWPSLAFVIGLIVFLVQIFHVDSSHSSSSSHKNQISSLERQWTRIRERSYGRMTSAGSERLVKSDGIERASSHNAVCVQH